MAEKNYYIRARLLEAGKLITNQMKEIIKSKGAVASGKLINSIDYDVIVDDATGLWTLTIEYEDYGYFVDQGRNPGRFPPKDAIQNWMRLKGIPQEALWPIMVKIKKAGFYSKMVGGVPLSRPRGIHFTDPFTQNIDLKKLTKELGEAFAVEIENEIVKDIIDKTGKDVFTILKR